MNSNVTHERRIAEIGRKAASLLAVGAVLLVGQVVVSWFAPIVAIPLLVAGWLLGFGLAVAFPFAIVAVVAGAVNR